MATATECYNAGVEHVKAGRLMDALSLFKKAVDLDPEFRDAHYNLGVTYYALGRLDDAKHEYEVVVKLRPNDVDALNNLGTILALSSKLDLAKELFDRALNFDPDFALTYRNLAAYYKTIGDEEKMAEYAAKAIELDRKVFEKEPGEPRIGPDAPLHLF